MAARPGESLRAFAQRRRRQIGLLVVLAIVWLTAPFWLPPAWQWTTGRSLAVPIWGWIVCVLPILACVQQGRIWLQQSRSAENGAAQAEEVADRLIPLQNNGWQASYGVREAYAGLTDILLISPAGHAYAIDVKPHRGRVCSNGRQIYRMTSRARASFERDFVSLARRQAIALKKRRKLPSVTPVLTFTNALIDIEQNPVAGVHIVSAVTLLEYLQQLDLRIEEPLN